ncbi:MAG: nucleotidyltransferase [Myxococcota bacterium]
MDLPHDFRDLLVELDLAGADFVVVGGYAVAFHGYPRATKDLDVFVRPTRENAARVYRGLAAFGAPLSAFDVGPDDFCDYDGVLQLGVPPFRIDILHRISGVAYDEAVRDAPTVTIEGRTVLIISRDALLANKRASGRPQISPTWPR